MAERCKGGITRIPRALLDSSFPDANELGSMPSLFDARKGGVYFVDLDGTYVAVKMNVPCSAATRSICQKCTDNHVN